MRLVSILLSILCRLCFAHCPRAATRNNAAAAGMSTAQEHSDDH
jgi:hypothetical protein